MSIEIGARGFRGERPEPREDKDASERLTYPVDGRRAPAGHARVAEALRELLLELAP